MDPRALVVHLELPYNERGGSQPPAHEIILAGLQAPSNYWVGLAIGWLEQGAPASNEIIQALSLITKDKSFSQQARHKSFALIKKWQRDNGTA